MEKQLLLYIRLSGKSYWRLFREIPFLLQIVFLLILSGILYFLAETTFTGVITNYLVVFLLFVLMGRWCCRMSSSEKVLLSFLNIPIRLIHVLKCSLLSLPFFLLDGSVGFLLLTVGTAVVIWSPERITQNRTLPGFYVSTSYQWLGMYRVSGIWILSLGMLFLLIALWHQNTNMSNFFLGWIITLPPFFAYYTTDPPKFLRIYKNSRFLIGKKLRELIRNIAIPTLLSLALVLLIDFSNSGLYLKPALFFIYIDLLLFYSRYICYPHTLIALALSVILIVASLAVFILYLIPGILICSLILLCLHFLAINNLKTFFQDERTETLY